MSEKEIDDVIASWNMDNYDDSVHKHGSLYPGRIKFKSKSKSKSNSKKKSKAKSKKKPKLPKNYIEKELPDWVDTVPILTHFSGEPNLLYDVYDTYQTEYNPRACAKLNILKNHICKNPDIPIACNTNMTEEEIKQTYENIIHCRNLRAIETNANCKNKDGYIKPEDEGHLEQIYSKDNAASKCIRFYQQKKSASRKQKGVKKFQGRRSKRLR